MRLAVDARELEGKPTGVGRYLASLLPRFRAIDPDLDTVLYSRGDIGTHEGAIQRRVPAPSGTAWLLAALPRELQRDRPHVFFGPGYALPLTTIPTVLALHDLSFERMPETFPRRERLRRRVLARLAASRASSIVCDSQSIASEIESAYHPRAPIRAIPLGVADTFFAPPDPVRVAELQSHLALVRPVVGFAGSLFNRRRPGELVAACARVFKKLGGGTLVLAGDNRTFPPLDPLFLARWHLLEDRTRVTSFLTDLDLRALLSLCDVFAWPSDYEGFGLPPLEAMASGVPVVSSNRGCLAENLAGAAVLVDENDAPSLATALLSVLESEERRRELSRHGLERARTFRWERCATSTLDLLRSMAAVH
ncbi:MAG: glycosyltransferase family 1 protein [Acidobacteriota bacterium]